MRTSFEVAPLLLQDTSPSWLAMVDRGATTVWEVWEGMDARGGPRPRPGGGITSATARHISPFGPIDLAWRLRAGTLELGLLVPPGTTATVVLPGEAAQTAAPGRHRWTGDMPPAS